MNPNYLTRGYQGLHVKQANNKKKTHAIKAAVSNWFYALTVGEGGPVLMKRMYLPAQQ